MKKLIKYVPDILILSGLLIHLINKHQTNNGDWHFFLEESYPDWQAIIPIMLIAIGINIIIRRYIIKK